MTVLQVCIVLVRQCSIWQASYQWGSVLSSLCKQATILCECDLTLRMRTTCTLPKRMPPFPRSTSLHSLILSETRSVLVSPRRQGFKNADSSKLTYRTLHYDVIEEAHDTALVVFAEAKRLNWCAEKACLTHPMLVYIRVTYTVTIFHMKHS